MFRDMTKKVLDVIKHISCIVFTMSNNALFNTIEPKQHFLK